MAAQPRIFVSHSHADNDFCQRLVDDLRMAIGDPAAVWMDASGGLNGGDSWWAVIRRELSAREVFLVILSPEANASPWVNNEIDIAWALRNAQHKRVIPILHRPCELRVDLQTVQAVSFLPPRAYEQGLAELLRVLGIAPMATPQLPVAGNVAPPAPSAPDIAKITSEVAATPPLSMLTPKRQSTRAAATRRRGLGVIALATLVVVLAGVFLTNAAMSGKLFANSPHTSGGRSSSAAKSPLTGPQITATYIASAYDHEAMPGCANTSAGRWIIQPAPPCNGPLVLQNDGSTATYIPSHYSNRFSVSVTVSSITANVCVAQMESYWLAGTDVHHGNPTQVQTNFTIHQTGDGDVSVALVTPTPPPATSHNFTATSSNSYVLTLTYKDGVVAYSVNRTLVFQGQTLVILANNAYPGFYLSTFYLGDTPSQICQASFSNFTYTLLPS